MMYVPWILWDKKFAKWIKNNPIAWPDPQKLRCDHMNTCRLCIYTCVHVSLHTYMAIQIFMYIQTHLQIYTHIYTYVYKHGCMYVHIYICMYTYIYICTYTHFYVHMFKMLRIWETFWQNDCLFRVTCRTPNANHIHSHARTHTYALQSWIGWEKGIHVTLWLSKGVQVGWGPVLLNKDAKSLLLSWKFQSIPMLVST